MPWLPLYATEQDLKNVLTFLNKEEEVAFIVSDGPKRWIAKKQVDYINNMRYSIWHIPSGPLPLILPNNQEHELVEDPWQGWEEKRTGLDPTQPFFGSPTGIIWFNARHREKEVISMSSFEWIGNHYSIIGRPAPKTTEKFWKRMGRQLKKGATRIPRAGMWDGPKPEIWTLPDALEKIKNGAKRDDNPSY